MTQGLWESISNVGFFGDANGHHQQKNQLFINKKMMSMKIEINADTPLSDLFRRMFHEELRQVINSWRPFLINDDQTKDALELCRFDIDKKRFTARQAEVYEIHLRSFWAAVDKLQLGRPFRDAHIAAATEIARGMKELGLMKGDPAEAAEAGAYALFFPCGLGHMMGLDVHDMENLGEQYVGYAEGTVKSTQFGFKSLRLARPLEPGFVFTVEPGIYFIPELMDKWQAEHQFTDFINYDRIAEWRDFTGLRNELNYVITEDGARRLGNPEGVGFAYENEQVHRLGRSVGAYQLV